MDKNLADIIARVEETGPTWVVRNRVQTVHTQ